MKQAKTTLNYKGKNYPFYRTNRGQWDFEGAGYTNENLAKGRKQDMLALIFFTVRDCAKRAGMVWTDSLDDFIDNSDPDVTDVFIRMAEQMDADGETEPGKPEAQGPEKS